MLNGKVKICIEKVKKIPRVGQVIIHDSYKFIVEIVDKKRIKQVKLIQSYYMI